MKAIAKGFFSALSFIALGLLFAVPIIGMLVVLRGLVEAAPGDPAHWALMMEPGRHMDEWPLIFDPGFIARYWHPYAGLVLAFVIVFVLALREKTLARIWSGGLMACGVVFGIFLLLLFFDMVLIFEKHGVKGNEYLMLYAFGGITLVTFLAVVFFVLSLAYGTAESQSSAPGLPGRRP